MVATVASLVPTRQIAARIVALGLIIGCFAASFSINAVLELTPGPNEYNIAGWEVRNAPGKWLFLFGELFRDNPTREQQDAYLQRFFELTREIEALEDEIAVSDDQTDAAQLALLDSLRDERDSIENQVEATIESRLDEVIDDEGLTRSFLDIVWPPVDTEFTEAPRSLAFSPRDHIELKGTSLLREDLSLPEVEAIEAEAEQQNNLSARAFAIGGLGAYPTLIDYPDSYERALELVAHEWVHNYLFFRPLGFSYFGNNDVRTINETVADLVGRELAETVAERWPLEERIDEADASDGSDGSAESRRELGDQLRELRGEVDDLLAAGRIDEAEALMEERRLELADQGYFIRKINQAYFAFLNLYAGEAGSPAATSPIGPKVDELRRRSDSLRRFVDIVGGVTSEAELDEALRRLE